MTRIEQIAAGLRAAVLGDDRRSDRVWLGLSLAVAAIPAVRILIQAFFGPSAIGNDGRHFVPWLRRLVDPGLFPDDPMADYFLSVTPWAYRAVFWLAAQLGLDPVVLATLLAAGLSLSLGWVAFRLGRTLGRTGFAGFVCAVLIVLFAARTRLVYDGIPRSFALPLLLLALSAVLRRETVLSAVAMLALAGTYPQVTMVAIGAFVLFPWTIRLTLRRDRGLRRAVAAAVVAGVAGLVPFVLDSSAFGPTVSAAEAMWLPTFQEGGRSAYHWGDAIGPYLCDTRGAYLDEPWCGRQRPVEAAAHIALLGLLLAWVTIRAYRAERLGAAGPAPSTEVRILPLLVVSATIGWAAAHLLLFAMHLPSRYTTVPLWIAFSTALGLLLARGLATVLTRPARRPGVEKIRLAAAGAALLGLFVVLVSARDLPRDRLVRTDLPEIMTYLAGQPRDALVASIDAGSADNIGAFASRSIWISRELAIPYANRYRNILARRAAQFLPAFWSPDIAALRRFVAETGTDFFLIGPKDFDPSAFDRAWWAKMYPDVAAQVRSAARVGSPAILARAAACTVMREQEEILVDAGCAVAP